MERRSLPIDSSLPVVRGWARSFPTSSGIACDQRSRKSSSSALRPATAASPRKPCRSGRIMGLISCTEFRATNGGASRSPTTRGARTSIRPTVSGCQGPRRCRSRGTTSRFASRRSRARPCSSRLSGSTRIHPTRTSSSIAIRRRPTCGWSAAVLDMGSSMALRSESWWRAGCSMGSRRMSNSGSPALLDRDFERFKRGLPRDFPGHVRETHRIDLSARYLGQPIPHPVGKGSGQLSLNAGQLESDAEAGLAFAVLKTVIAQNAASVQSMAAWAIHETKMRVERRGDGWTVTWKGRGWDRSFDDYLALVRAGRDLTRAGRLLTLPSVKYHLPRLDEPFRDDEYAFTTRALADAWGESPLLLEKDFSPTLAGDALADEKAQILRWLREVPARIRQHADVRLAMKLMNARFDDAFQIEMVNAASSADALVVFNRLFDAEKGVAYGGAELSDRNLRVLDFLTPGASPAFKELSGTGNIHSGRMIVEYALRGCSSVQLHTFFQLPLEEYPATEGSRTQRALHALIFAPRDGLIAVMREREVAGLLERSGGELRFLDLVPEQTH